MRVFNLTDVKTPVLEQRGLVAQSIAVAHRMVAPGEYVDVEDTVMVRSALEYLLTVGAVAIDNPPPTYLQGRQAAEASSGRLSPIPVRHVEMKETAVADGSNRAPLPAHADAAPVALERHDPVAEPADDAAKRGKKSRQ